MHFLEGLWQVFTAQLQGGPRVLTTSPLLLLLLAAVSIPLVLDGRSWRFLGFVSTVVHETGHALAALMMLRRLQGISMHLDHSGETRFLTRRFSPVNLWCAFWGYPFGALVAWGYIWAAAQGRQGLAITLTALVALLLLTLIRNAVAFAAIVSSSAAVLAAWWFLPPVIMAHVLYVVGWLLLWGSLRTVVNLLQLHLRGKGEGSDATSLWRSTLVIPPLLWGIIFLLLHGAAVAMAVRALLPQR